MEEVGESSEERTMPGRAMPARAIPGRVVPGRAMPGRAMPGRVVPGRVMPGRAMLQAGRTPACGKNTTTKPKTKKQTNTKANT